MLNCLILLVSLFSSLTVFAGQKEVYNHIKKLHPRMDEAKLEIYSHMIYKHAKKARLDEKIVVAIAQQESSFRNVTTYKFEQDDSWLDAERDMEKTWGNFAQDNKAWRTLFASKKVNDIGIMQVNISTAASMGFDVKRLLVDVDYQIQSGIEILSYKIKICYHKDKNPWACYHSRTPANFLAYQDLVSRWMP